MFNFLKQNISKNKMLYSIGALAVILAVASVATRFTNGTSFMGNINQVQSRNAPSIKILSPNGGEFFEINKQMGIAVEVKNIDTRKSPITVSLVSQTGSELPLTSFKEANPKNYVYTYTYQIPNNPLLSGDYKIKATANIERAPLLIDTSDATFNIKDPNAVTQNKFILEKTNLQAEQPNYSSRQILAFTLTADPKNKVALPISTISFGVVPSNGIFISSYFLAKGQPAAGLLATFTNSPVMNNLNAQYATIQPGEKATFVLKVLLSPTKDRPYSTIPGDSIITTLDPQNIKITSDPNAIITGSMITETAVAPQNPLAEAGVGATIISTNLPETSYTIYQNENVIRSHNMGSANKNTEVVNPGTYRIVFGPLSGYTTPEAISFSISAGEEKVFEGNYIPGT